MIRSTDKLIAQHSDLADSLRIRVTDYMPHMPTPKQRAFLSLPNREALYGGAAGGGKSDALLMGALQYVDIPFFKAIIFRRTLTDLRLPGALLDRSAEWLRNTDAVFDSNSWRFPSGAVIQFGYLDNINDKYRYQGAEFQYIAFDELTQFRESDYLYLFSRLRRTRCPDHPRPNSRCPQCIRLRGLDSIPLRLRAATNPGGIGHLWVKRRFNIVHHPHLRHHGRDLYVGQDPSRPHIPAFVEDNPYLDQLEYIESLQELDPITREQLLAGDWSITSEGRFRRHWLCRYTEVGQLFTFDDPKLTHHHSYDRRELTCFFIIDPAASIKEGPGDEERGARKQSWTVFTVWYLTPDSNLILAKAERYREESPYLIERLKDLYDTYDPDFIGLELSPISSHIFSLLKRAGFPMKAFKPKGRDKLTRATSAINRMEAGQIWFPHLSDDNADWLEDFETNVFTWTAHPDEPDDEVDCIAYAGHYVAQRANDSRIIERSVTETPAAY